MSVNDGNYFQTKASVWLKRYRMKPCPGKKRDVRFAIYLPPQAETKRPVLYWFVGLTCTDEISCKKPCAFFAKPRGIKAWRCMS